MTRMLSPDKEMRRFTLARFELFMEGTRRPELQPFLQELRAAAVKSATVIFESAGFAPTPDEVDQLSTLLQRVPVQQSDAARPCRAGRRR